MSRFYQLIAKYYLVSGYILHILMLLQCLNLSLGASNTNINENIEKTPSPNWKTPHCSHLLLGQYLCDEPAIDSNTQQAKNCDKETRTVIVTCRTAPNVTCHGGLKNDSQKFTRHLSCKWTNGHSFETSLLLSIFLGMFGVDRFYLGYPAIGLLKFSTLGFMFLGQLIDILLIATQVVKPADGSDYVIDYYGPVLTRLSMDNKTYIKPPSY